MGNGGYRDDFNQPDPVLSISQRLAAIKAQREDRLAERQDRLARDGDSGVTRPIPLSVQKAYPEVRGLAPPAKYRESNGGQEPDPSMVTPEVESPITTGATIINTIVDKYKSNPNPKPPSGKAVTGIPITRQPGFKRRETGRLLARVIGVEFDPDYLKATTLEKAIIAGIQVPPSYDRPGVRERYITQKYEGIMGSADYVGRRRQALESFEQNMDVPTAVCLAEAARRDPQFAVLRRRLRQMDEKRRVGGDQRDQFGQLMDFLKGGDTNARPPLPQQAEQGFAGIDDRPYLSPSDEQDEGEPITARSQPPWSAEPQQREQESQEPW